MPTFIYLFIFALAVSSCTHSISILLDKFARSSTGTTYAYPTKTHPASPTHRNVDIGNQGNYIDM